MRVFFAFYALLTAVALGDVVGVPPLTGRVVDVAGVISGAASTQLNAALERLERERGVQMAVLTLKTVGDEPIEALSIRVVEAWKLGKKGNDRGLLFVFAPSERKMRLEVGYGLEGAIPDATVKRILASSVRPYFRDQRYADGALAVVEAVDARVRDDAAGVPNSDATQRPRQRRSSPFGILVFFGVFLFFASSILGAGRRRRGDFFGGFGGGGGGGWGGGGSGGGFSGGGGGFGGGGASSDW